MNHINGKLVKCLNEAVVESKLLHFTKCGVSNLQVIADFDFTMTGFHPSGTCFGAIRTYPGFSDEFLAKTTAIKNKHYPIHIDNSLPEEVRLKSDLQWFEKIMACFVQEKFHKTLLKDMLERSTCRLRKDCKEFLELTHKYNIPVLIFSGGIKDIIVELLEVDGCYFDNISIIANRFKYDNNGIMVGPEEPYITASTKMQVAKQDKYFGEVKRDNVLLLGDMLSDLKMASCAVYDKLLSLGFCNEEGGEETYLENFDVVLFGNPSFGTVNDLFKSMVSVKSD